MPSSSERSIPWTCKLQDLKYSQALSTHVTSNEGDIKGNSPNKGWSGCRRLEEGKRTAAVVKEIACRVNTESSSKSRTCLRLPDQQAGIIYYTQDVDDAYSNYDAHIERVRGTEYPQLKDTTYLDHAGTTLYAQSLVVAFAEDLKAHLFGNPHSASPSSCLSTRRVDGVRAAVLNYFKADPEHFDVVFVANATAAIKLVMHSFQEQKFSYRYHKDAHTSLVGIREVATAGSQCFASNDDVEDWLINGDNTQASLISEAADNLCLFAYPAQSNMTGHRLPLSWASDLRQSRHASHRNAYSLLDAASYLTTGRLDLSDASAAPDFITLSFYKMFGFPDLGALIVRKEAGGILRSRRYFGGGTVDMVIDVNESWHAMRDKELHEVLEDGTLPFHNIVALQHAMDVQKRIFGSAERISQHVSRISSHLYQALVSMRHYNGRPVVHVYQDIHSTYGDGNSQGPIIAFNVLDSNGEWIGKSRFEKLAIACGIQLRTGGVCNPGGIATMLQLEPWEMRRNFCEGMRCGDDLDVLGSKPTGIIRASLGAMTTMKDVETLAKFITFFFVESAQRQEGSDCTSLLCSRSFDLALKDHTEACGNITLIEGCRSFTLPRPSTSPKPIQEAYAAWDREWCIVDQRTGMPLRHDFNALRNLAVSIQPHTGVLKIKNNSTSAKQGGRFGQGYVVTCTGALLPPDSSLTPPATPTNEADFLTVDLWTPPPEQLQRMVNHSGRIPDAYTQPDIAEFLTEALGIPCTLARYRPKRRSMTQAQNCVIPTCKRPCSNPEELKTHYAMHNSEFYEFVRRERWEGVTVTNNNADESMLVDIELKPRGSLTGDGKQKRRKWAGLITLLKKQQKS